MFNTCSHQRCSGHSIVEIRWSYSIQIRVLVIPCVKPSQSIYSPMGPILVQLLSSVIIPQKDSHRESKEPKI